MSDSGDDQNEGGQDGQPQGGQPQGGQGGQPQGGQPQGGQPQGGQPQGGQPPQGQPPQQGGQPPQGQPPQQGQPRGQPQQQGTSVDIPPEVQNWGIYGAIVFAIAGGSAGLFSFLLNIIDQDLFTASGVSGGAGVFNSFVSSIGGTVTAVFVLTFVGIAFVNRVQLDRDTLLKTGAAIGAIGGAVTFLLVAILTFIGADGVDLEFGGLLIYAIVAALCGAISCVGGVWAELNQAPDRP